MTYISDRLKIGPVSGEDRNTLEELASGLGVGYQGQGDYLIVGPMSTGDRETLAAKAQALVLRCQDYFEAEPAQEQSQETAQGDLTPVMETRGQIEKVLVEHSDQLHDTLMGMSEILDKLAAAGKVLQ